MRQLTRFWNWAATWRVYDAILIGGYLFSLTIHEYILAIICLVACAVSASSKLWHEAKRGVLIKLFGTVAIVAGLVFLTYVTLNEKEDLAWSHLSRPLALIIRKEIQVTKPFVPTPENWAFKLEAGTTAIQPPSKYEVPRIKTSMPPPLHRREQFLTNLMLYNDNMKLYCTSSIGPEIRQASCGDMQNIFQGAFDNHNVFTSLSLLIQHELVEIIFASGQQWGSRGETDEAIYQKFFAPIDAPDVENYRPRDVLRVTEKDAPLFPYELHVYWNEPRMRLPRGTEISLLTLPTENNGPDLYTVRVERKGYFKIDIGVTQHEEFRPGQTPEEYHMGALGLQAQIRTYTFLVGIDWTVDRSHDPTFSVEDYDHWANQLASRIRERLNN